MSLPEPAPGGAPPFRQIAMFYGVGIAAAIVHYGTMIGLVETGGMAARGRNPHRLMSPAASPPTFSIAG